jgi:hypothetical protein
MTRIFLSLLMAFGLAGCFKDERVAPLLDSASDRVVYASAEDEVRVQRRSVGAESNPGLPWDFCEVALAHKVATSQKVATLHHGWVRDQRAA